MRRIQLLFPGYISLQWLQEKVNTRWRSSARFFLQNWVELTEDKHKEEISGEKLATFLKNILDSYFFHQLSRARQKETAKTTLTTL